MGYPGLSADMRQFGVVDAYIGHRLRQISGYDSSVDEYSAGCVLCNSYNVDAEGASGTCIAVVYRVESILSFDRIGEGSAARGFTNDDGLGSCSCSCDCWLDGRYRVFWSVSLACSVLVVDYEFNPASKSKR